VARKAGFGLRTTSHVPRATVYFCDPDFVTPKWKPTNYRLNRFSEWHLADGIKQSDDGQARPSLATAKTGG
jgi:hypothetical protein